MKAHEEYYLKSRIVETHFLVHFPPQSMWSILVESEFLFFIFLYSNFEVHKCSQDIIFMFYQENPSKSKIIHKL